ncbi:hypothetical protein FRC10_005300 [Ceratobasidium sp. 414]|nr:hypothetical protein FRC10_005300 [Ceratobasidium sp. 414]
MSTSGSTSWVEPNDDWTELQGSDAFLNFLQATDDRGRWDADNLPLATLPPELSNPEAVLAETLNLAGIADGNRMGVGFVQCLERLGGGNSIVAQGYADTAEALMQIDTDFELLFRPTVVKRRQRMSYRWSGYLIWRTKDLPPDKHWLKTTVLKHWETFFFAMVDLTKGRSGEAGKSLRSTTIYEWGNAFIWLVGKKCVDETGAPAGNQVLYREGLLQKLKDRILWFSHKCDVERHGKRQSFVGRTIIFMMVRSGFKRSEVHGRIVFQQHLVGLTIYMKLEDLDIRRVAEVRWNVTITIKHRKNHNSTVDAGTEVQYLLEPMTKIHNLLVDAGVVIVVYLLMRGAIEGCSTLNDIFQSKNSRVVIKKNMLKEPLFLERTAGGGKLGTGPASAKGMTASFKAMAEQCGILDVTGHSIRREAGDRVGLVLGAQAAQELLTHEEDQTTFNRSYSHNTLNIPVAQVAMGELDDLATSVNQMALKRHSRPEAVVRALIAAGSISSNPEDETTLPEGKPITAELTAEDIAAINARPEVLKALDELRVTWERYYELMPPETRKTHGQSDIASITKAFTKYGGTKNYQDHKIQEKLRKTLGPKRAEVVRAAKRSVKDRKLREVKLAMKNQSRTTEQENAAHASIDKLLTSDDNLPELEFKPLMLNAAAITKGEFGRGILTEEAIRKLANPALLGLLETQQARDEEVAQEIAEEAPNVPNLGPKGDGVEIQHSLPKLTDKHEMQVIDADMTQTVKAFMEALYYPAIRQAAEEALAKANNNMWPCLVCRALPPSQRVGIYKKTLLTKDEFPSRARLLRHQSETHSDWMNLAAYMVTEIDSQFKCPLQECGKRFSSITEMQEHCLTECSEQPRFSALKEAHDNRRRGVGSGPRISLKARKMAAELALGMEFDDDEMARIQWWKNLTSEKVEDMAAICKVDPEELKVFVPELAEAIEEFLEYMHDGVLHAPGPGLSAEQILEAALTPEMQSGIDNFLNSEDVAREVVRKEMERRK